MWISNRLPPPSRNSATKATSRWRSSSSRKARKRLPAGVSSICSASSLNRGPPKMGAPASLPARRLDRSETRRQGCRRSQCPELFRGELGLIAFQRLLERLAGFVIFRQLDRFFLGGDRFGHFAGIKQRPRI